MDTFELFDLGDARVETKKPGGDIDDNDSQPV